MNRRTFAARSAVIPLVASAGGLSEVTSAVQSTPAIDAWDFETTGFEFAHLDVSTLLFNRNTMVSVRKDNVVDSEGVPVAFGDKGNPIYNPVTMAQYLLRMLSNYLNSDDMEYLNLAVRIADRLAESAHEIDGALFFPYNTDHRLAGPERFMLEAPWYSGMAQGHVLQSFTRLWQVTNETLWLNLAKATAASFKAINDPNRPPIMRTNDLGELWIEEYPASSFLETLNGHMFGYLGLYEYWMIEPDPVIQQVLDGAMTTVLNSVATRYRVPGQPSFYVANRLSQPDGYHVIHTARILETYRITQDQRFAELAILLHGDYPPYGIRGDVIIKPGEYQVFAEDYTKPHLVLADGESLDTEEDLTLSVHQRRRLFDQDRFFYRYLNDRGEPRWIEESNLVHLAGEFIGAQSDFGPLFGTRAVFEPPVVVDADDGLISLGAITLIDGAYHASSDGENDWFEVDIDAIA